MRPSNRIEWSTSVTHYIQILVFFCKSSCARFLSFETILIKFDKKCNSRKINKRNKMKKTKKKWSVKLHLNNKRAKKRSTKNKKCSYKFKYIRLLWLLLEQFTKTWLTASYLEILYCIWIAWANVICTIINITNVESINDIRLSLLAVFQYVFAVEFAVY